MTALTSLNPTYHSRSFSETRIWPLVVKPVNGKQNDDVEAQPIAIIGDCHYPVKVTLKFYKTPLS